MRYLYLILVALLTIGCGARGPAVLDPSQCVSATEMETWMAHMERAHSVFSHEHALLHSEHYSICRIKHRMESHGIRTRSSGGGKNELP